MNAAPFKASKRAAPTAQKERAPWKWALAGALLSLIAVLILAAPARWLATTLARGTGGVVQLQDAQGSVWSGSARLVLTGGAGSQGSTALPGRIHWKLRPAGLGVRAQLTAECCTPGEPLDLRITPSWNGARLALTDGKTAWPAAVLTGLGTPWNTIQPQGELELSTRGLSVEWLDGRVIMGGSAEFTARHMSSRLSTLQPLGSYRMTLTGGDSPSLDLSTLEGALRLAGKGQWVGSRLRFSGEASAAPGMETQLANLLNIIGRRQGERAIISLG
ncbi:type II secretion system protein N [Ottowia thiooxydans]|uniref:type II secretion system protein N n=1 Tax=Ottowia thiooxydans TaxID=219182 RepID=UPI0003F9664D|nr:type II secretion system protein N [Ottowia thiooxydans]